MTQVLLCTCMVSTWAQPYLFMLVAAETAPATYTSSTFASYNYSIVNYVHCSVSLSTIVQ